MDKISIATNIDICTREEQIILCNQYEDNTRQIVCNIQKDGADFNVPSDMSVYIRVYKTLSGCGVYKKIGENNFGSVSENIVTIPITKEMTISYGKQECNLEFRNADDDVLYTSNFILRGLSGAFSVSSLANDPYIVSSPTLSTFIMPLFE